MKIAILNLSNNVSKYNTVSSAETLYIAEVYRKLNHDVTVISNKDTENTVSFENAKDPNEYDRVLVLNGAVNFFGGKENPTIINAYKFLAKYKKSKILYLLTDLRLPFKQLWPQIANRGWGYTEEEVYIDEANMKIISQAHNLDVVQKMHPGIDVVYAPLERYKLLFQNEHDDNTEKTVDLIYGGSFRAGNRRATMLKYLFDTDYSVEVYGNIKLSQFKLKEDEATNYPNFTGKIKAEDVIKYNNKSLASLVIGDNNYNANMLTLRVWEILLGTSIILIDNDFDPDHMIMDHPWFYVKSKEDIAEKINQLKDKKIYEIALSKQRDRLSELFNIDEYLEAMEAIL